MLDQEKVYAVVGASANEKKYGYMVCTYLLSAGCKVIPINPREKILCGQIAYPDLFSYEGQIDVVIFVVPPLVTQEVIQHQVLPLGIRYVWMQPGSESEQAILFCQNNGIEVVAHACIMQA